MGKRFERVSMKDERKIAGEKLQISADENVTND